MGCSHWPAIFNWSNQPKESSGKSITTSSWVFPVLPKMVVPKNHWFSYSKWAFWGVLGVPPFKETSSWFQPIWTNCTSQIGFIFPKDRGENKKNLEITTWTIIDTPQSSMFELMVDWGLDSEGIPLWKGILVYPDWIPNRPQTISLTNLELVDWNRQPRYLLLMEEILHHLRCEKPCK